MFTDSFICKVSNMKNKSLWLQLDHGGWNYSILLSKPARPHYFPESDRLWSTSHHILYSRVRIAATPATRRVHGFCNLELRHWTNCSIKITPCMEAWHVTRSYNNSWSPDKIASCLIKQCHLSWHKWQWTKGQAIECLWRALHVPLDLVTEHSSHVI
jgi:hypothetical protein